MTHLARDPQNRCGLGRAVMPEFARGNTPTPETNRWRVGRVSTLACIAAAFLVLTVASPALAQDPSIANRTAKKTTFDKPSGDLLPSTEIDRSQPLYLQGDQLIYDNSGNSVIARGNVEIYYNNYVLTADEVVYDQSANTLNALGNVILREPNGSIIRADSYTLTDDFRDGFVQSLSVVAKDDTRIAARQATRREGNVTEFSDAKFTPCKSEGNRPPLWCISSRRIIHDKEAATITYNDAQFEFFGQPIIYLPYFQHPDPSVKRRSGFLAPSFGTSSDLGLNTTIPYYFALAPNYDFTFAPRFMTQQGTMYQGQWRHRLANGEYLINMAGIDQRRGGLPNKLTEDEKENLEGWRGTLETKGLFSLASWWNLGWDVTLESDDTFRRFYGFDGRLVTDRVNQVYFKGLSDRNYLGTTLYHFGGLLLDDAPNSESRVHPLIDYNYVFDGPILGGELRWDSNLYSLTRDDIIANTDGQTNFNQGSTRAVTEFTWRRRLIDRIGITYTPFANVRGDITTFHNYQDPYATDPSNLGSEQLEDDTAAHGVAAAGATIAYPWVATTYRASHTIEPIGQIITRTQANPRRNRPNEDAKSLVFDDTNLFEIDKFSGYDRIETGTRANAGVQYTFQLHTGGYARLLGGQSFQLSGENPFADPGRVAYVNKDGQVVEQYVLNPSSGLETTRSDYILGAYIAPIDNFRLLTQSRFDEDSMALRREDLFAAASFGPVNASSTYSYTSANPELGIDKSEQEISGSLGLQLTERWSVTGLMRYDIDDDFLLSDSIRLRYADECFVLTASYTERLYESEDLDPDRTVYLAFEFKHLGLVDYKTDIFSADNTADLN